MSGYELVLLETRQDYQEESRRLHHGVEAYFEYFQLKRIQAYSLRKDGESVLTLSVQPEGFTSHIVGKMNRQPTEEEFSIVAPLLATLGIENRYDPNTLS